VTYSSHLALLLTTLLSAEVPGRNADNGTPADWAKFKGVIRLSRFKLRGNKVVLKTEQKIMDVPVDRGQCCHVGGNIEFDLEGNLAAKSQVALDGYVAAQPGWLEHDGDAFWKATAEACQQLWREQPALRRAVRSVAVTTQRGTVVRLTFPPSLVAAAPRPSFPCSKKNVSSASAACWPPSPA